MPESKPVSDRRALQGVSRLLVAKIAVTALAVVLAIFQLPAGFIERFYARGLYPHLQAFFTPLTNHLPFALYDVWVTGLLVGLPAWWIARLVKAEKGKRLRLQAKLLGDTLVLLALVFLLFQLLWGFNYMRLPLTEKLDYDAGRVNQKAALSLYQATVAGLNLEVEAAHQTAWPDDEEWRCRLQPSYNLLVRDFGQTREFRLAKAKATIFDKYLEAAGITGFINPFGHETIAGRGYHPLDRAFTLAHEWGHLAGYAEEAEASFAGLLALLGSDDAACRYSGYLALYLHLPVRSLQEQGRADKAELPKLSRQVEDDLQAMNEAAAKRHTVASVSRAQWQIYDQFLKVQHTTASYNELIRLVLGTEFDGHWQPLQRQN